mmetsp:Transcript_75444/g.219145  ORF Transcript_75444/g.219145 Transcript_75444/m.219145 type:complete len:344 (-) Transcript_75444:51-1082(-)|eukprot:CAMPEP_0176032398 /NCGR_PEP_ID=MMETSP0120_2-20121206/15991_1 /TAXON_ID=160619 /ORGANISM="Kryptoperidinium foliaceum, Strain CCMP 1326" /LENGTH=343 /DNA_ID=CAMNT_0017365715 /DNA_START=96 /DNA_END=1127 /DNA_ORIENTATION=+
MPGSLTFSPSHHRDPYKRRGNSVGGRCCQAMKSILSKLTVLRILLFSLTVTISIHRIYANYRGSQVFVHAPIHTLDRKCPEPTYPTIGSDPTHPQPKICLTTLTDELERSWLQKLLRWRNFDGLLQMTWSNKQSYADKYGYHLFDESKNLDRSRPPSWSKIKAVRRLLMEENCDWVWWVDADTVIMNSDKRLEDFLPTNESPQDLLLSQDHNGGFNAGGWLIRFSPFALEFLDTWWDMKDYVKPTGLAKSGDNDAFKAMLAKLPEFDQHILVPPRCTFNSFAYFMYEDRLAKVLSQPEGAEDSLQVQPWYLNEAFYHKGDLLAHVAGYDNKEQPVSLLLEIAQ